MSNKGTFNINLLVTSNATVTSNLTIPGGTNSAMRFTGGISMGNSNTSASVTSAVAVGKSAAATSTGSIALGTNCIASANYCIAVGFSANAAVGA